MASWSYHKLVAQYGEEQALLMLMDQVGFGEFDPKLSHYGDNIETVYDIQHGCGGMTFPLVSPCMLKIEVGWARITHTIQHRKMDDDRNSS